MSEDIFKRYGYSRQSDITNAANVTLFGTPVHKRTPFTSKTYAIYTGNIGDVNNSVWLLDAARILKQKQREDIIILLIGEGQQREMLEQQAQEEGIANFVRLGLMPKEELVGYIQQSLVSLVPLKGTPVLDTSSPNKFFESLSAGVPVVQNTNGWMKEFLDANQVGFTVDPNNPDALADLLIRLAEQKDLLKEMGQRAKVLAMQHFDKDVLAKKMLKIIEDVAKK